MKKILIFSAVGALVGTSAAFAVQKCVALTSSTDCTYVTTGYGQSNWTSQCGDVTISGIAFCGSTSGSFGSTTNSVSTSTTSDSNVNCWCKMTSPAVSKWVWVAKSGTAGECLNVCAYSCAYGIANVSGAPSLLFSGLTD